GKESLVPRSAPGSAIRNRAAKPGRREIVLIAKREARERKLGAIELVVQRRRIPLYLAFRYLLFLSGPPFFATLPGSEHLAPRSLRLRSPVREDLRAKASHQRLRCFLRADAAWSCLGLARSRVSAQAAMREQSGQASPFSVARMCQSDPPTPDSLSGSLA